MYDMHSIYIYIYIVYAYVYSYAQCMHANGFEATTEMKPQHGETPRRRDAHRASRRMTVKGNSYPMQHFNQFNPYFLMEKIPLKIPFWWRKSHWKFHESPFFRVEHPVSMVEKSHEIANLAGWNLHFFHVFFCRTAFQAEAGPSNTSHWAKHHFFWGDQWWYRDYRDIDI